MSIKKSEWLGSNYVYFTDLLEEYDSGEGFASSI
jgi:hypothetical protein